MSVDLSEFEKLSKPKKKPCVIAASIEALDDEAAAQLQAAVDTDVGVITNSAIQKWLEARGITSSTQAVTSHRKGSCTCRDD